MAGEPIALARNRHVNNHPHPTLADAVSVSRFWRNVDIAGEGECWEWRGDADQDGYGIFYWHDRRRPAHELALSFGLVSMIVRGIRWPHVGGPIEGNRAQYRKAM